MRVIYNTKKRISISLLSIILMTVLLIGSACGTEEIAVDETPEEEVVENVPVEEEVDEETAVPDVTEATDEPDTEKTEDFTVGDAINEEINEPIKEEPVEDATEILNSEETEEVQTQAEQEAETETSESGAGSGVRTTGLSGREYNFDTYDNPEQQQTSATYVLNTNSMKFHLPECSSVAKIAPQNYATGNDKKAIVDAGYEPCKICNP